MTRDRPAQAVGTAFQQARKDRSGAKRIAARRFSELSRVRDVPAGFLFGGTPSSVAARSPAQARGPARLVRAKVRDLDVPENRFDPIFSELQ
ncbi:MAG: hypothetical protein ACE5KF_11010 [Kiloniellaceae bacterium]